MKCYTLKEDSFVWKIAPTRGAWILKRHSDAEGWVPIDYFGSPADAADAVAEGRTTFNGWDSTERRHPRDKYLLPAWELTDE